MTRKRVKVDIYHHKSNDSRRSNDSRSKETRVCARCNGKGAVHSPTSIFGKTCPTCGGKGWNPV